MLVTKVEVQQKDKNRANLYLDDKFFCGISMEIIIREHIKVGLEIDKQVVEEWVLEDEKHKAMNRAIKYMSSNLKTTKQIRDYLRLKEYSPVTIDYVIEKMLEYKYLDDEAYAKAYILTYSHKYGKLRLIRDLKAKGVKESIIESLFEESNQKSDIESVASKYLKNKEINAQTIIKLNRFLCSRGFEYDEIHSYLNKIKEK